MHHYLGKRQYQNSQVTNPTKKAKDNIDIILFLQFAEDWNPMILCKLCKSVSPKGDWMKIHYEQCHPEVTSCEVCISLLKCRNPKGLYHHIRLVHLDLIKVNFCIFYRGSLIKSFLAAVQNHVLLK